MAIPDYQTFMLPVLRIGAMGECTVRDATEQLGNEFELTGEEKFQILPGGSNLLNGRVGWAITYLVQAGLLERPKRGYFKATERGEQVLKSNPETIDNEFLGQFDEFQSFIKRKTGRTEEDPKQSSPTSLESLDTPEERIDLASDELSEALSVELLNRVRDLTPKGFEKLILRLMESIGYGNGNGSTHHLGQINDGGVDGVINEDILGLNSIYLQAKRYKEGNHVGAGEIRDFAGALDGRGVTRGVFFTTSRFTKEAIQYAKANQNKQLILIDGDQLTKLMTEHDVAVRTYRKVELKKLDYEYFNELDE